MKNLTLAVTGLVTVLGSFWLSSTPASAQAPPAAREGEVALIGCVEMERDYRARKESGRGGALGTGVGVGNEFVLTMAKPVAAGRRGQGAAAAAAGGDYELTGKLEKELLRYVGRQVEVIGVIEKAGEPMPAINITLWHPVGDYCPASPAK